MHLKRSKVETTWPVPRKGTKYLARPMHNLKKGISLIVILRDILKIVKTKKEARYALNRNLVFINEKPVKKTNYPITLFDVLYLKPEDVYYRLIIENNKFKLKKIGKEKANLKICRIENKKILKKNKIQLNLNDGRNILVDDGKNVKIGDSVKLNLKNNKIEEIINLKKGAKGYIIKGRYSGKQGDVENVEKKELEIKVEKEKFKIKIKNFIVIK